MSTINRKRTQSRRMNKVNKESHKTFEGGAAWDINNPLIKLHCIAASSFFGEPAFYKDGSDKRKSGSRSGGWGFGIRNGRVTPLEIAELSTILGKFNDPRWENKSTKEVMEECIDEALDYDPKSTLDLAVGLRKVDNIRTTPQVIMVRAANHKKLKGTQLIRKYNAKVMLRADEPPVQLAYQLSEFGKPVPNSLKRSWADFMTSASPYMLAKYRMENRAVKAVDVGNIAHGTGFYGYKGPIGDLMRGELKLGGDNKTWEQIRSEGGSWEEAIEVMGHMALLRNLRNFTQDGVNPDSFLGKLVNTAKHGKQLPFRHWTAYRELQGGPARILDAIEECLEIALENIPYIKGRSLILTDVSGSMDQDTVSGMSSVPLVEVARLMGVLTGMRSDEGVVGIFANRLACYKVRKKSSVFDQVREVQRIGSYSAVGRGTNNPLTLALKPAIQTKEHWDNIFVYSDMQVRDGGLMLYGDKSNSAALIEEYRRKVNPNVYVFLVQMGGYDDTLLPDYYNKTFALAGWSGRILDFVTKMHNVFE